MSVNIGDRVKATLAAGTEDECVLVGEVQSIYSDGGIYIRTVDGQGRVIRPCDWTIEVPPPPRPEWADRVGAVVLDRDGLAWQRGEEYWCFSMSLAVRTYEALVYVCGPLTPIHIPEDES